MRFPRLVLALSALAVVAALAPLSAHGQADGAVTWAVSAGGPGRDDGDGIGSSPDGGVIISGGFDATASFGAAGSVTSAGGGDVFAAAYDRRGRARWVRRFGGPARDQAFDSDVDRAGRAVLTGTFGGTVDFGTGALTSRGGTLPEYGDAFVAQLGPGGRTRWVRQLGGPASDGGDEVASGPRDDVFVIGDTNGPLQVSPTLTLPSTGGRHAWAARLRADGRLVWARSLGGPGEQISHGIAATAASTALVTGEFRGVADVGGVRLEAVGRTPDVFVGAVGPRGAVRWARSFGGLGRQIGRGVDAAPGGDVLFTGEFADRIALDGTTLQSAGGNDLFVARADRRGRVRWAISMGGAGDEIGPEVEVDRAGNAYVVGTFVGSARFGGRTLTGSGAQSAFVAKVSPRGRVLWVTVSGEGPFTTLGELTLGRGGVTVLGRHAGPAQLGRFRLGNAGRTDLFVARLPR